MFDLTEIASAGGEENPLVRVVSALERIAEGMERATGTKAKQEKDPQRTLTPAEFAKELHLHPQTAMAWCRVGRVSAAKVGGKWLIPKHEAERLLRGYQVINGKKKGGA